MKYGHLVTTLQWSPASKHLIRVLRKRQEYLTKCLEGEAKMPSGQKNVGWWKTERNALDWVLNGIKDGVLLEDYDDYIIPSKLFSYRSKTIPQFNQKSFNHNQDTFVAEASDLGVKPGYYLPSFTMLRENDKALHFEHVGTDKQDDEIQGWRYASIENNGEHKALIIND